MQVHGTGDFSPAIIVDTGAITRLWRYVEEYAGSASATVSCADGIEREFSKLEALLDYENSTRAAVRTIELYGRSREPDRSISVIVGRQLDPCARLSIRGDEQEVTSIRTRILDLFAGMRAWYSPVATLNLSILWAVVLVTTFLLLDIMVPSSTSVQPKRSLQEALQILGALLLVFASIIFMIAGSARLRSRYFPMVAIALGQGVQRYHTDEQVRWTVIIGFLVGVAGSATYALLSQS